MNELPQIPNYHIGHLVAEGGTAKVYWGIDLRSGFPVAIKELKIRHINNPIIKEKFKQIEAQLYLRMKHRNIPRLVDFIDIPERQLFCIVMEFVNGRTLEQYIYNEIGLIPEKKALPIFVEVLDTVAYLHSKGILHLDIKSNNIMLQPDGNLKLLDLGIASRMSEASSSNTGFGTPAYMPPEQSEMRECGRYTDIFALGIMLFEMLTGNLPFTSNATNYKTAKEEIRNKIKFSPTPQMKQFYPVINDGMQVIVERALAKVPENRFQTCEEFKDAVQSYMRKYKI